MKNNTLQIALMAAGLVLGGIGLQAQVASKHHPGVAWGDQGNGTYINPVLDADFSDPDAIRVGDTYYMVASDFHFMGMQVLASKDLVNWKYISQIYNRFDLPGWNANEHYGGGSWAPSIRYHAGRFYVYFCTPDEGLFMTSAASAEGPWDPLTQVYEGAGWEDPCPFWDDDGQAYLGHSLLGAGPIILHRMSPDGTKLLDDGVEVYRGPVAEGTKIHKWNGWYYYSIPEGGVGGGVQVILRSASLYGPFDKRVVLEQGSTEVNGPHQGAIVDTPSGQWWFLHFQLNIVLGRVVHLQPMHWEDGWPVMGVDIDRNGVGEPVHAWDMPEGEADGYALAASDTFDGPELGLQWQFNHNPVPEAWSLTRRRGYLCLAALPAPDFREARNILTQKLIGEEGTVTAPLDLSGMKDGQRCGIAVMGSEEWQLGVRQDGRVRKLYIADDDGNEVYTAPCKTRVVTLGFRYDIWSDKPFQFLIDGKEAGAPFESQWGAWKGVRPALYCYNTKESAGEVAVDEFRVF